MENILEGKTCLQRRSARRYEEQMQRNFQEMTSVIPPYIKLERFLVLQIGGRPLPLAKTALAPSVRVSGKGSRVFSGYVVM